MKKRCLSVLLAAAIAASPNLNAQDPAVVPQGTPSQISDWALAGVVWSDAALLKKLAAEAAKSAAADDAPDAARQYQMLAERSDQILRSMEAFGWKQVNVAATTTPDETSGPAESSSPDADAGGLPDPQVVGRKLLKQMGGDVDALPAEAVPPPAAAVVGEPRPPVVDPAIKRFDTETPAGQDDPGVDDEMNNEGIALDVDNYRVDDYIDETPREARNRVDAIEDGVEGAIASAAGRLGMGLGNVGRISEREALTQMPTVVYGRDSIYDSDDYDPDIDYDVDNLPDSPEEEYALNVDLRDPDDDIDLNDPADVVDGEDELIAAMARREQAAGRDVVARPVVPQPAIARTDVDRYTADRGKFDQDANWVQFHLDANQAMWQRFTTAENLYQRANDAAYKLKVDMSIAIEATDNEQLKGVLEELD